MLKVMLLHPDAKVPTVANLGDLGFDLYASENTILVSGLPIKVPTGIAVEFEDNIPHGFLIRDRSSMASKGVMVSGGVIDAGYRGEISVIMTLTIPSVDASGAFVASQLAVRAGDKIAQILPLPVLTNRGIVLVDWLSDAERGCRGFGSSGS